MRPSRGANWTQPLDNRVERTLDLARALIEVSDLDTTTESLLAHVYAVSALTGASPRATLENVLSHHDDDHTWFTQYLPVIMGDAESILD